MAVQVLKKLSMLAAFGVVDYVSTFTESAVQVRLHPLRTTTYYIMPGHLRCEPLQKPRQYIHNPIAYPNEV